MINAHGKMGLQVWTPSVLDMQLGLEQIQRLTKEAGILLVASNLDLDKKYGSMKKILKLKSGKLTVGIIGLVGNHDKLPEGVTIRDPEKITREMVKTLTNSSEPVDLIIVLSNMGIKKDQQLAQHVDGIDFIFSAGDDRMVIIPRKIGHSLLFEPYKQGEYLGLVSLKFHHLPLGRLVNEFDILKIRRKIQKKEGDQAALRTKLEKLYGSNLLRTVLHPIGSDIKDDPELVKMVEDQLSKEAVLP